MSKNAVNSLIMAHDRAFSFLERFIDASSDKTWSTRVGGDPAWQHLLHALATSEFFLAPKEGGPELPHHFSMEVVMFQACPSAPSRDQLKTVAREARAYTEKFLHSLSDAELDSLHEGAGARMGAPLTNVALIANLIGHLYYHFGHCDAALRDNGEKGLF
ncbi:MAG: hypothetical protein LBM64_00185 [Deltaproteobacteria bacterium]|jgi:hypothetical protein|nr:hypothetical protein [Deltaproteobacteria bacterium]